MKLALVGSSGYISSFLIKEFEKMCDVTQVLKIDQTEEADVKLNLLHAENFNYNLLRDVDYVIFTAAISSPDRCSSDFDVSWKINVIGTQYFIAKALKCGCKVLFFSSDAVFGDEKGKIYTEISETKAETAYGKMKKAIEDNFKNDKNFKAIRLSYVVSLKDKFLKYCISCIKTHTIAEIYHPFYRNCISVDDVVKVVVWLILNWNIYEPFVLNVAGKELVSRIRIADELNRNWNEKLKYKVVEPSEAFYQNRPKITQMKSLYLQKYKIIKNISFSEKIKKELER